MSLQRPDGEADTGLLLSGIHDLLTKKEFQDISINITNLISKFTNTPAASIDGSSIFLSSMAFSGVT